MAGWLVGCCSMEGVEVVSSSPGCVEIDRDVSDMMEMRTDVGRQK